MQYLNAVQVEQAFFFTKPVNYDSSTTLKWTSYSYSCELAVTVETFRNFIKVLYTPTAELCSYLESGVTFNIQFGTSTDQAQTIVHNPVIQYNG